MAATFGKQLRGASACGNTAIRSFEDGAGNTIRGESILPYGENYGIFLRFDTFLTQWKTK